MRQLGRILYVGSTLFALAGWKSKVVMGWTLKMMIVPGWTRSLKLVVEVGGMIVFSEVAPLHIQYLAVHQHLEFLSISCLTAACFLFFC